LRLIDDVIDELHNHQDQGIISTYRTLYNTVNDALDFAALMVAREIQRVGYRAYPVPASSVLKDERLVGAFSHKVAASLSGLGWIGKSCLLITPDHGPRLRLTTVLTDAPLSVGTPIHNSCGTCSRCVDICPAKAFTGRSFNPSEPRGARFKAQLCNVYTTNREKKFGNVNCGLCVYICPFGNKRAK
jgi:epoxyqueuosine reductase QueG